MYVFLRVSIRTSVSEEAVEAVILCATEPDIKISLLQKKPIQSSTFTSLHCLFDF